MSTESENVRVEQEELETIKQTVLTRCRRRLVDSIDPANHLSYLRSKFVFTERDAEEVNAPPSRSAKAEIFLDKLSRKGSQGYDEFQNSLCRDRTQLFLLEHMTKTLELLKHKLKEFKVQQQKEQMRQQRQQQKMPHVIQPYRHPGTSTHYFTQAQQKSNYFQQQYVQPTVSQQQTQRVVYHQQQRVGQTNGHYNHTHTSPYGQSQLPQQQHQNYSYHPQRNYMGYSPPPHYQAHVTVTSPPMAQPSHSYHPHNQPRQNSPHFQSRDANESGTDTVPNDTHDFLDEFSPQGSPLNQSSPLDTSEQPCGQPT